MSDGKKMTLGELFARKSAEAKAAHEARLAYEATPEGRAEVAERAAHDARMRAAEERFAIENPTDYFKEGALAAGAGMKREAPDDVADDEADQWLAGYDSETPDESEA